MNCSGPGGFLQWQENDACDSWTTPETPMTSTMINYVISEKVARGLLPGLGRYFAAQGGLTDCFLGLLHHC